MSRFHPDESLGFHCNLTVKAFLGSWEEKLKEAGISISPAQVRALAQLIGSGAISQSELVDRLSVTPATGVRLVDRMERDGWVVRQPDLQDGRVKLVAPTKRALEIWEHIAPLGRKVMDQAYQEITPAELETVKRTLAKVRRNLGG